MTERNTELTQLAADFWTWRAYPQPVSSDDVPRLTYQIGKIQLMKFLADARQTLGENFSLRAFHHYVWKNGYVPVSLLRWEYPGLSDEIEMPDQD